MKILAKNYNGGEDWAEYALITIDDAAKKEILEARELFQMVKGKNKSLTTMEFWDGRAEHFSCDFEDAFDAEQMEALEDKSFVVVPDNTTLESFPTAQESRTVCDCLVVTDTGFYWNALNKHTNDAVETPELSYELLVK